MSSAFNELCIELLMSERSIYGVTFQNSVSFGVVVSVYFLVEVIAVRDSSFKALISSRCQSS